mgnify:CR=1 FL=1
MRKDNIVRKCVGAGTRQLCNDLGLVLGPLGAAKVVISVRTASENALLKKHATKTTSQGLQDASRKFFDLQGGLKRVPKATHKTLA